MKIRQEDYRPFLLNLYALVCYAAASGNRYASKDAMLPGNVPGEGSRYGWSAVIDSTLQPTLGLRWSLCSEESDADVVYVQKAAPKRWFAAGQKIAVRRCPTRCGQRRWETSASAERRRHVTIDVQTGFRGELRVHLHAPDGKPLTSASTRTVDGDAVVLAAATFAGKGRVER